MRSRGEHETMLTSLGTSPGGDRPVTAAQESSHDGQDTAALVEERRGLSEAQGGRVASRPPSTRPRMANSTTVTTWTLHLWK